MNRLLISIAKEGNDMTAFRTSLMILWLIIVGYTAIVMANHGFNLLPIFFGDIRTMAWPGQFNLDFMLMLILSGLWVSWRHQFSLPGLTLGLLAVFGGALFLTTYLLVVLRQDQVDMKTVLLGKARAANQA